MNWQPLLLSLQVTAVATVLMVVCGLPLALLLARRRFRGAALVETLVSLPLVLPPTVVGYYLLLAARVAAVQPSNGSAGAFSSPGAQRLSPRR